MAAIWRQGFIELCAFTTAIGNGLRLFATQPVLLSMA
jgi:hypothetical protein